MKTAMAAEGVMNLADTKLFTSINTDNTDTGDIADFKIEFAKIFKVIENHQMKQMPNGSKYLIKYKYLAQDKGDYMSGIFSTAVLADGTIFYYTFYKNPTVSADQLSKVKKLGGKLTRAMGDVWVDINGLKGPNQSGRDLFGVHINEDGTVYPEGGFDASIYYNGETWKSNKSSYSCDYKVSNPVGDSCAGRVMEENWQMNY